MDAARIKIEAKISDYFLLLIAFLMVVVAMLFYMNAAGMYADSVRVVVDNCQISAGQRDWTIYDTVGREPAEGYHGIANNSGG